MRPLAIVLGLAIVVAAIAVVLDGIPPAIDATAASTPIARTVLTGPGSPDVTEGPIPTGDVDPDDQTPPSPWGGECLDRIVRGSGYVDLCWQAWRSGNEMDPTKDYYVLRLHGSYESVRWLVIGSQVVGVPGVGSFEAWPEGTYEGACRQERVGLFVPLDPPMQDVVCGHSEATSDTDKWWSRLVWRCERCLLPDATTHGFALYNAVGVTPGTVPSWDLFADAGG